MTPYYLQGRQKMKNTAGLLLTLLVISTAT